MESSANKLTIVRPRRVGNFFIGASETFASSAAVSKIAIASALLRSFIESKCFIDLRLCLSELHRHHQFQLNVLSRIDPKMLANSSLHNPREWEVHDVHDQ